MGPAVVAGTGAVVAVDFVVWTKLTGAVDCGCLVMPLGVSDEVSFSFSTATTCTFSPFAARLWYFC